MDSLCAINLWNWQKVEQTFYYQQKNAGFPILRVETNFASGILPKAEQGRILLEENNWGHVLRELFKDCLISVSDCLTLNY